MKIVETGITATLIIALIIGAASFTIPSLIGRPVVPGLSSVASPQLPSLTTSTEKLTADVASEIFTLGISGNIYFDRMPVEGAIVSIYLNGVYQGQVTAGQIYTVKVDGVRMGDTVRADASYQGFKGTASQTVKFKNIYLDVNIVSGRSFIRNGLELLTSQNDKANSQQQPAAQQVDTSQIPADTLNNMMKMVSGMRPNSNGATGTASVPTGGSPALTGSSASAQPLTSQIFNDANNVIGDTRSKTNNAFTRPADAGLTDTGGNMKITNLNDALNVAGLSAPLPR